MKNIREFLKPTRSKIWIAIIVWTFYWLVGKIDISISFPLVSIFYPDYISHMMETFQPQSENLISLMGPNAVEVTNLFLAVHIAVAAVLGYLGACLIVFSFSNGKAI